MIPYDDLVAALQQWRAQKGLPVSNLGQAGSGRVVTPVPTGTIPGSGIGMMPPAPRTGPPRAPMAVSDETLDVDEASLIEEQSYENEGGDYAMQFDGKTPVHDEATLIGGAPEPSDTTNPTPRRGKPDRDDW